MSAKLTEAREALEQGDYEKAWSLFDALIAYGEEIENAHIGKVAIFVRGKKYREAAEYIEKCGIHAVEMLINLASCYRYLKEEEKEIEVLRKIARTGQKRYDEPYRLLAQKAKEREDWEAAYEALVPLFHMEPEDFSICFSLADACKQLNLRKQAITYFVRSIELAEGDERTVGSIRMLIGSLYKDCAQQNSAVWNYQEAYRLLGTSDPCSNLVVLLQYFHQASLRDFYAQCVEYNHRFIRPLKKYTYPLERLDPKKEKLTIGFMSGDFIAHSLSHLILQVFRYLNEVAPQHTYICYMERAKKSEDKVTEIFKQSVDLWRSTNDLSDEEAAKLVHDDEVDVLIDLAGHTACNRLKVFGHRPAPVQASWISGMMTPPAVETINYFFTDQWMLPPSASEVCPETLLQLPSAFTYFPLANVELSETLPCEEDDIINFGSFNNPCKISTEVLETWADCLKAVPRSRMHIKIYSPSTERNFRKVFERKGIAKERVVFVYQLPTVPDVMRYYTQKIDIVLDTWPCAGMLTSTEALWMGVPIITLVGDTFLHRQTWSVLNQLKLEDLGAETRDEFVEKAQALATDRERLKELRKGLRARFESAPMRDARLISSSIVKGCEQAWADRCESRAPLKHLERRLEPVTA